MGEIEGSFSEWPQGPKGGWGLGHLRRVMTLLEKVLKVAPVTCGRESVLTCLFGHPDRICISENATLAEMLEDVTAFCISLLIRTPWKGNVEHLVRRYRAVSASSLDSAVFSKLLRLWP